MRIERRNIKKVWGEGYVTCVPTDDEDLWHIYNLIQKGDHIRMKTSRKIIDETNVSGLKKIRKRILTLTLQIVEINYFAKEDRLCISIKGRNSKENEFLKIGQFHTFEIELETKITIYKEEWPLYEINLIKEIAKEEHGVEIAAMVMEEGVAHLCYVKQSITLLKKKIERNISKKNAGDEIYRKSLNKFFQECYNIIATLNFERIKCFVIASPGFLNDQLLRFIKTELEKENDKGKTKWLDKIVLAKCSNGYLNSLNEVLADPTVIQKMENTKAISQSKTLEEFYDVMKMNENKVAYGEKEVTRCIKMKAVQKLLISDYLFRNKDFDKRRNINKLYEEVKNYNGQVVVFSSLHPSGEKLKNITGIAAILRFDVLPL